MSQIKGIMQNSLIRAVVGRIGSSTRRILVLATITAGLARFTPVIVADPGHAQECVKVGGAFSTNFIADDQTAGTATGDLKGALGVKLLGLVSGTPGDGKPVVFKVQHFWVTETGDTILTEAAEVTGYPGKSPSQPLLYSFVYENGVKITGGTGKVEGATGLTKAWGSLDFGGGQAVGRYSGVICFVGPGKPK
jgi:hypothetical protein